MSMILSGRYRHKTKHKRSPRHFSDAQAKAWHEVNSFLTQENMEEIDCLCGAKDGGIISEIDRYNFKLIHKICRDCGIIRQTPVFKDDVWNRFYRDHYRSLYRADLKDFDKEFESRYNKRSKEVYEFVEEYIKNGSLLDVGCGGGWTTKYFEDKGFSPSKGIDLDARYIGLGQKKGLDIHLKKIEEIDEGFDLVILSDILEHVKDAVGFLEKADSICSDRGYLYISLPGVLGGVFKGYAFSLLDYLQIAHIWLFSLKNLQYIVEANTSFRLVKGDQAIAALFQKNGEKRDMAVDPAQQYNEITAHLRKREPSILYRLKRKAMGLYCKKI